MIISRVNPQVAARMLAGLEQVDPLGAPDARDVLAAAERGECFSLTAGQAHMAYVLLARRGQAWIAYAGGKGDTDWTELGLRVIEAQARECGRCAVGFQTTRRGLVRKAVRRGYAVTGYILKKDLQ